MEGPSQYRHIMELAQARKRAALSVAVNLVLAIVKGAAGIKSGSTALLSDAIHSATDVLASAAAWVGLWAAGKKHPSFPYGLYRAETVATLVISAAILLAAYEIGKAAIFCHEHSVRVEKALPVAGACLIVTTLFGLYQLRAGRRFHSPALVADAKDYLADSLSTAIVFVGLLAGKLGFSLDRWAAAVVSLFVFRAGGILLSNSVKELLDAAMDRETERRIIEFVEGYPTVVRVERVLSRIAGGRFIVDVDVIMKTPSHELADKIADRIEEEIIERFPQVVMARIRPHFGRSSHMIRITPVQGPDGTVSEHIGQARFFMVEKINRESGEVESKELVENPYRGVERQKGLLVGKMLLKFEPDQLVIKKGQKKGTAVYLLEEAGVEVVEKETGSPE